MAAKNLNRSLNRAKKVKQDEFYTQLGDIEDELNHYEKYFKNKTVYCNCDDPRVSNFFHYFSYNFERLGLKKLISTCYKNQNPDLFSQNEVEKAIFIEYKRANNGKLIPYPEYMKSISQEAQYKNEENNPNMPFPEDIGIGHLKGDGDFRSAECIEFLKRSDIVVTNPPFSLFREYVTQLIEYDKKFLIIGSMNAITYKEIFKLIKENKLWLGFHNTQKWFQVPDDDERYTKIEEGKKFISMGNTGWFTNLDIKKRHEDLLLYESYKGNEKEYPKYDNYDAINVDKVADIPENYAGVMGVPMLVF